MKKNGWRALNVFGPTELIDLLNKTRKQYKIKQIVEQIEVEMKENDKQ
jgi:membrane protease subunit (stomatin/prohibitin family)